MIWYCRSRALLGLGLVLLASAALSVLASGAVIPLPSLVSVVLVLIALSLLTPPAPVIYLGYGLARADTPLERVAVRAIARYDLVTTGLLIVAAGMPTRLAALALLAGGVAYLSRAGNRR